MSDTEEMIRAGVIIFGLFLAVGGASLWLWLRQVVWAALGVGGVGIFVFGLTLPRIL